MRLALAWLACSAACGFRSDASVIDAGEDAPPIDGEDAAIDGEDAAIDAMPDGPVVRVRDGLIGLWEFDDAAGATISDTSDATPKVPLTVSAGSVTFANSTMTPNGVALIASTSATHLNSDVVGAGAVTLEAWVMPARDSQGSISQPVLVAGLCGSVVSRNISILQAGTRWVVRVRTTADRDGKPDLMSTTDIVAGAMTHLVVVADATQRVLYVDGQVDRSDPSPGPLLAWDMAYKMALGNELSKTRQWDGTFALVALYRQALSKELVDTNFKVGANGR